MAPKRKERREKNFIDAMRLVRVNLNLNVEARSISERANMLEEARALYKRRRFARTNKVEERSDGHDELYSEAIATGLKG